MKECVLVTGGAGFIGCAISQSLCGSELPLLVVDNLHPQVHASRVRPGALAPDARLVIGDVCDEATWNELLQEWRPRRLIHLAAETGTGQSLTEASRHASVNVLGLTRMLDALAARRVFPDRFVLTSSRAVYGEGLWKASDGSYIYPGQRTGDMLERGQWSFPNADAVPFRADTTNPSPTSIYGATKLAQEHLLASWASSFGSQLVTLRLQNVYGPGQSLTNPYTGIVSLFSRIARGGGSIPLYEDGLMRRDFVFIDDVASAVVAAASSSHVTGGTFDVGTGLGTTIGDLANAIARHYNAPPPHVTAQFRNGDVRHAACDTVLTQAALGWEARVSLQEGVRRLCDWIDEREAQ